MIRRKSEIRRKAWMPRGKTPLPKVNVKRQAKKRASYKAFLSSPAWKRIRLATFAHDGWRCTATIRVPIATDPHCVVHDPVEMRCPYVDETRTGKGLVCDHSGYQRFGGDEIPGEDTRTYCTSCDRKQESERRPWNRGRKFA